MLCNELNERVQAALEKAAARLIEARGKAGHWTGELSSSALSTATATCALSLVEERRGSERSARPLLIRRGLEWLAKTQNADGGWGDTVLSGSNISTTVLCWAAFGAALQRNLISPEPFAPHLQRAEKWIAERSGTLEPRDIAHAILRRYGKDRTFSVPILTMCALAGRLGTGRDAWEHVIPLPFELAAMPPSWFAALRLPVVSYALPALIAIGQVRHLCRPSRNPAARVLRHIIGPRTLRVLERIQPSSGGFLEATPLTSFVLMSLAGCGFDLLPVASRCEAFLCASVRADGSWPIDTNLATWVTTLSVNALRGFAPTGDLNGTTIREWLLNQQYRQLHPYTNAPPGGWAWTDLPGGVPDADDTAGALLALRELGPDRDSTAVEAGLEWLLNLQNRDGGIPTFCRGWGALPFDRSSPDLTAHAIRAWLAWLDDVPQPLQARLRGAILRAVRYLAKEQRPDGAWIPLWFGNEHLQEEENPIYGTSRVVLALCELANSNSTAASGPKFSGCEDRLRAGKDFLISAQSSSGAWPAGAPESIEETALALEALARVAARRGGADTRLMEAVCRGAEWLVSRVENGAWTRPAPIGFYFAKLWYYEALYPLIFSVAALRETVAALSVHSAEKNPPDRAPLSK
jgi:squalene-hopene/tetraprenyl-beta-curcumene cyclase